MTQQRPPIKIELVSDPAYLCGAREFVSCIAHRVGFDDMACSKIALAVDEAMCNVIRHGYKRESGRPIWITIHPTWPEGEDPGALEIVIEDEGVQVDPDRIVGRDLSDIRPGGLGVHIMREVMDFVEYSKRSTRGMCLRMGKKAPAVSSEDEGTPVGVRTSSGSRSGASRRVS